jgi:hypothetical protein
MWGHGNHASSLFPSDSKNDRVIDKNDRQILLRFLLHDWHNKPSSNYSAGFTAEHVVPQRERLPPPFFSPRFISAFSAVLLLVSHQPE